MHSFLPTPISESRWALKKITRVGFSGLNQGFGSKQGVLFSSPNHWLDCRLIPWKWLTQESWYRKSTCLWWNCLHFLCADCRPRLVQSVLPCRYLDLWPVPWDTPSPPVLFFSLYFLVMVHQMASFSERGKIRGCVRGKIPLLRGFSSVFWQVNVIRTGMIFIAYAACLLDSACLARKDKKTYGHTYCTWMCVSVCKCERGEGVRECAM